MVPVPVTGVQTIDDLAVTPIGDVLVLRQFRPIGEAPPAPSMLALDFPVKQDGAVEASNRSRNSWMTSLRFQRQ